MTPHALFAKTQKAADQRGKYRYEYSWIAIALTADDAVRRSDSFFYKHECVFDEDADGGSGEDESESEKDEVAHLEVAASAKPAVLRRQKRALKIWLVRSILPILQLFVNVVIVNSTLPVDPLAVLHPTIKFSYPDGKTIEPLPECVDKAEQFKRENEMMLLHGWSPA
ncbi:UNVERIFIED_CONTAM: hypothetical protein HDU68_012696 [Siphonaria sp. JEL0065]|nr:hypothetical protein HDU68_012696 [Siphonaria sp. JEL0065]